MSISAVASSPATPALLTQFTSSSGAPPATPSAVDPASLSSASADRVTIRTQPPVESAPAPTSAADNSPAPPSNSQASADDVAASVSTAIGSFVYSINGQSYSTSISTAGGEYTATVPGLGTISAPSEAAVEATISVRISELA